MTDDRNGHPRRAMPFGDMTESWKDTGDCPRRPGRLGNGPRRSHRDTELINEEGDPRRIERTTGNKYYGRSH